MNTTRSDMIARIRAAEKRARDRYGPHVTFALTQRMWELYQELPRRTIELAGLIAEILEEE